MVLVNTTTILLILAAFLGSAREMVEALTIVLGVGVVRGWRKPLARVPENRIKLTVGFMLTSFASRRCSPTTPSTPGGSSRSPAGCC